MNPAFPIYIVSKGRWNNHLTVTALKRMKVPFHIIVEEQEYKNYSEIIDKTKILILDQAYKASYDTFGNLGSKEKTGPGPARNFAWDHALSRSSGWHWVMDDNIWSFYRLNKNQKIKAGDGTIFKCMEEFCLRYKNIAMAGPNYESLVIRKSRHPPFIMNTRIYSCNLIRNDVGFRWRGRYNEDTDLSLRLLKAGWCTVQFNAFLQNKIATQRLRGGNTDEFYEKEGTLPKSIMLVQMHPDVTKLVWKFNRWHHHVDYTSFKTNKLLSTDGAKMFSGVNNYGMTLVNAAENSGA